MNTKLLSNRMFSKNIEEKFLSKYGNAKGDIKRILSLSEYDISNHSLNLGISLYGCINEIETIFDSYLKNSENIKCDINNAHLLFYNYIKYIQLNVDKLDIIKISSNKFINKEILNYGCMMNRFFTSCTLIYTLSKIDNINNVNANIYIDVLLKIIKNTLNELRKANKVEKINLLSILFKQYIKGLSSAINYFEECWNNKKVSNYLIIIFNNIIDKIFDIGENNRFYKKIIRELIFDIIIENDESMKINFYKDKYFQNKDNIFNFLLYTYFNKKF